MPEHFLVEVINTACYIQNRSLIHSMFKKTPYELWNGKKPNIGYFHIFSCTCYILNNGKTYLTKFQAKLNEGIFLGYSTDSKTHRVFNKRLLNVEGFIHVTFEVTNIVELTKAYVFDENVEQD